MKKVLDLNVPEDAPGFAPGSVYGAERNLLIAFVIRGLLDSGVCGDAGGSQWSPHVKRNAIRWIRGQHELPDASWESIPRPSGFEFLGALEVIFGCASYAKELRRRVLEVIERQERGEDVYLSAGALEVTMKRAKRTEYTKKDRTDKRQLPLWQISNGQ